MQILAVVLAGVLATGQGTTPQAARGPNAVELRELSMSDLLSRVPNRPWEWTEAEGRKLKPEAAELRRRAESGSMSADDWSLVVQGMIRYRPRWPNGLPFSVWVREPAWLSFSRITLTAINPDIGVVVADNSQMFMCGLSREIALHEQRDLRFQVLPVDTTHIELDAEVEGGDFEIRRLWQGRVRLPIEVVHGVDQAVPPASSPEIQRELQQRLRAEVSKDPRGWEGRGLSVIAYSRLADSPGLRGVAFSVSVDLEFGGSVVAKTSLEAPIWDSIYDGPDEFRGSCYLRDLPSSLWSNSDLTGYSLRFTGTSENVLETWEADRWWKGTFTMPLSTLLEAGKSK